MRHAASPTVSHRAEAGASPSGHSPAGRSSDGSSWDEKPQPGTDAALVLLRLILAAVMGAHGLIKVFGFFGGPGMASFEKYLQGVGFHQVALLSWVTGLTEVGCSTLLIVGFATPLAAAGLFGQALSLTVEKLGGGFFEGKGQGFEMELMFTIVAVVLLLVGSGRWSLDVNMPWRKNPLPYGLVTGAGAVVASIVVMNFF
jgi:putative oxidoreductase